MLYLKLVLYALFWIVIVYGFSSLVARKFKKINLKVALLYMATLAMLGVFGEVLIGSVYKYFFGHPFWLYTVLPVHHGYTSKYALFLWGIYGFCMYLLHDHTRGRNIKLTKYLPLMFMASAIIFEALVNLTFLVFFGKYIFYYFPSDLWHLTSVQVLPFYLLGGFILNESLKKARADPIYFTVAATALASVFVFLT